MIQDRGNKVKLVSVFTLKFHAGVGELNYERQIYTCICGWVAFVHFYACLNFDLRICSLFSFNFNSTLSSVDTIIRDIDPF